MKLRNKNRDTTVHIQYTIYTLYNITLQLIYDVFLFFFLLKILKQKQSTLFYILTFLL